MLERLAKKLLQELPLMVGPKRALRPLQRCRDCRL
jgi:hypothetical protein